jgi:hypothetical protein
MSEVKLLVAMGYSNADYGVHLIAVSPDDLPVNVAPSMVCDELTRIPRKGEIIKLGDSGPHYFPSDVMVRLASDEAAEFLASLEYDDDYVVASGAAWKM